MDWTSSFKKEIEKNAGAVSGAFKFMKNHPYIALGGIGGLTALGVGLGISKRVHPLHQIVYDTKRNKLIKEQSGILNQMLKEHRRVNPPIIPTQELLTPPLA